jgi:ribosomal protein S18 acetylase RimI-like enzyme
LEKFLLDPKTHALHVAEDSSKNVVGFVSCGPNRNSDPMFEAEVYAVYVLQGMQRRGIGRQLIRSAVTDLKSRGFNSMIVWVLADNPSREFYKRLGGEHVQTRNITIGGTQLEEYGYGWKDLNLILSRT